jgi:PLP dependent protein
MIKERVAEILKELPPGVTLVAAAKTRTPEEILEAVEAGVTVVGHNYVQEAERAVAAVGGAVKWHMIGHLQSNKAKKAALLFDMVETVDSMKLARALDKASGEAGKAMEILIEVNIAEEEQKAGVMPADMMSLARTISELHNLLLRGLMTMGPLVEDAEMLRPHFRKARQLFETLAKEPPNHARIDCLSMGMSDSYRVAVEEGATMVRLGTTLFGPRQYQGLP